MNNTVPKTILGVMSALVLIQAAPVARSQESGLSEIIVTARRVEERLQDVPISITVFNQQQLNNRNIVNAQDLAAFTPSLSANNNFGDANTSFAIRGFVQDIGTPPSVGVYFADVVAPRGASNNIPIGDGAGPGSFFDLQNVQVLKGPQGTLFGRNTTGGAILLVPQKPTSKQEGYVEYSFGNYAMKRVQAVVNVPISDNVRLRFGIDHQNRDGFETMIQASRPGALRRRRLHRRTRQPRGRCHTRPRELYDRVLCGLQTPTAKFRSWSAATRRLSAANSGLLACAQLAPKQRRRRILYLVEHSSSPDTLLTQWQTHQHDDLARERHTDGQEHRELRAVLTERYRSALFGTNLHVIIPPHPPARPSDRLRRERTGCRRSYGDESTFTEELQLQGRAVNGSLNWQTGAYLENVEPLALVGSQSPVLIDCTNSDNFNCIAPPVSLPSTHPREEYFYDDGIYEQANVRSDGYAEADRKGLRCHVGSNAR